jgi:four helix bundle protein
MNAQIKSYKDLIVWQKALELVDEIYDLTKRFPKDELYGLTNQIRRAAVSVPSNIAEGHARQSRPEFRNFLSIARGSLAEVETQLIIAKRQGYLKEEEMQKITLLQTEVSKMLMALFKKIASPSP